MITAKGKYFYKNGKRFFYLADTCWSAFTNISMSDWRYYLDKRKAEGFNVIQMNVLRQWDSYNPVNNREPFEITKLPNGNYEYDYSKINEQYFDNAVKMLEEMKKRDMVPALVLLWGNFVPNTWMSRFTQNNTMEFEQIKPYVSYVVNKFKEFHPIWIVSGDVGFTDFAQQKKDPAISYYREVIDVAKANDPTGLCTFHINGGATELPDDYWKKADFFVYQSGHIYEQQSCAYSIPQKIRHNGYKQPILDAELCYEGLYQMKAVAPQRYSAVDVRRAAWKAVLSGADAGLGYGAYGIWPWNDTSRLDAKMESKFELQASPYDWHDCLEFRGAEDMGVLKNIILDFAADGLNEINEPVKDNPEIRAAENDKYILIYLPVANSFDFTNLNINVKHCKVIDLQARKTLNGEVKNNVLQMLPILEDELVIVECTDLK